MKPRGIHSSARMKDLADRPNFRKRGSLSSRFLSFSRFLSYSQFSLSGRVKRAGRLQLPDYSDERRSLPQRIDTKTGKPVASFPFIEDPNGTPGHKWNCIKPDIGDPNRAFDPKTGRNFVREACPATKASQPPPTPTPSTTDKVTDVLKTIGSSVNISIGGGGGGSEHRHGDRVRGGDRTRTADKVHTDSKTHKTSPSTTHKTVTSACKCHPCTCSPCRCH